MHSDFLASSILEINSMWNNSLKEKEKEYFILKHLESISGAHSCGIYHIKDHLFKLSLNLGPIWSENKKQLSFQLNQGLIGRAYKTKEIVVANDVNQEKDYYHLFSAINSVVVLPIEENDQIIKVIVLFHRERGHFTDQIVKAVKAYVTTLNKLIQISSLLKKEEENSLRAKEETDSSTTFLSTVSHELRTPLHATMGMLEIIEKTSQQNEIQEYASLAYKSADQLLFLVNDILDYAKVKSGKLTINNEVISLTECIEETITLMAEQAHAKGLDLFYRSNQYPYFKVLGDRNRIRQILQNLINNAIKFTEAGHVSFSIDQVFERDDRTQINFTIKDTGIGISPEKLQHIFEPFIQAHRPQANEAQKGSGLGLAITKDLVVEMNGTIRAKSILGEGSSFSVSLQFDRSQKEDKTFERPINGSRVLIASSKAIALEDYRSIINTLKGRCITAHSVEALRTRIEESNNQNHCVDLAIIDEEFVTSSPELLSEIHNHEYLNGRIVVTANYTTRRDALESLTKGYGATIMRNPLLPSVINKELLKSYFSKAKDPNSKVEESSSSYGNPSRLQVLVVEDGEVNRYILSIQLKKMSIAPTFAKNGYEGLALLEKNKYDLAFLDIRLPDISGYDILTEIMKNPKYALNKKLYTVGISANTRIEEKRANRPEHLFTDFLSKPIRFHDLQETVQRFQTHQKSMLQTLINLE